MRPDRTVGRPADVLPVGVTAQADDAVDQIPRPEERVESLETRETRSFASIGKIASRSLLTKRRGLGATRAAIRVQGHWKVL